MLCSCVVNETMKTCHQKLFLRYFEFKRVIVTFPSFLTSNIVILWVFRVRSHLWILPQINEWMCMVFMIFCSISVEIYFHYTEKVSFIFILIKFTQHRKNQQPKRMKNFSWENGFIEISCSPNVSSHISLLLHYQRL